MPATYYHKHTDEDLFETYQSMLDYSGRVEPDLMAEIEHRGGMEVFLKKLHMHQQKEKEKNRIADEVYSLCRKGFSLSLIKSQVKSPLLHDQDLNQLVEEKFNAFVWHKKDVSVSRKTLVLCVISFLITSTAGSAVWGYSVKHFGALSYVALAILAISIMVLTQFIVGKTTSNVLVFATGFLSIIASYLLGVFLL